MPSVANCSREPGTRYGVLVIVDASVSTRTVVRCCCGKEKTMPFGNVARGRSVRCTCEWRPRRKGQTFEATVVSRKGAVLVIRIGEHRVLIDAADERHVVGVRWCERRAPHGSMYFSVAGQGQDYLHRRIAQPRADQFVDHRSGDTFDNRSSNLRACTRAENAINRRKQITPASSRYKGVYWNAYRKKWCCEVQWRGHVYRLGGFSDEAHAAAVYDEKARELFGEFAALNFPRTGETGCLVEKRSA